MTSISWADAPNDPAGQALYRVSKLEDHFLNHVNETRIHHEFYLLLFRQLFDSKKLTKDDLLNAFNALKSRYSDDLRETADSSSTTITQQQIESLLHDILADIFFPETADLSLEFFKGIMPPNPPDEKI